MTKLDDLRDYLRNKNKPKGENSAQDKQQEQDFSIDVDGSEASRNPLASFGDDETDPNLVDQLYLSPKNRPLRGEGATYWDQE